MPTYTINYTDINKDPIVVDEGSINEHDLDIALIGRIRLEYGERLNQNLLNLLENFSSDADPSLVPATATPMPTTSVTPSGLPVSLTPTPTVTRTPTRTVSVSASVAVTASPTATPTPTPAAASPTPTITVTPTIGASPTPTVTVTPTQTPNVTITPTPSGVFTIDLSDIPTEITGFRSSVPAVARLTFNNDGTFEVFERNGFNDGLVGDWTSGTGSDYELFYTYTETSVGGTFGDPGPGEGVWNAFPVILYAANGEQDSTNSYIVELTIRKISDNTDAQSMTILFDADGECFAVGTQMLTPTGLISIENLDIGDTVTSYSVPTMIDETDDNWRDWKTTDISGLAITTSTVRGKRIFTSSQGISINGLVTTKDHIYFVFDGINYGWKNASTVLNSDKLVSDNGALIDITEILLVSSDTQYVALDVETNDTLIVNSHGTNVLAHNISA